MAAIQNFFSEVKTENFILKNDIFYICPQKIHCGYMLDFLIKNKKIRYSIRLQNPVFPI